MFSPIVRRNTSGGVYQALRIREAGRDVVDLVVENGGADATIGLDDAALDEAITQLCIIRTNRRISREAADGARQAAAAERQEQRFAAAMQSGR